MSKTEVYILSGFLGSGKTSLLTHVLNEERRRQRKVAVLMNELGKVSIDSAAVTEGIPLKELLDGCICCTIQDKLETSIYELLQLHCPEVIYIETTGVAHPIETLDGVMSPLFANQLEVKGIITVVDGTRWLARETYSPQIRQLFIEQVRHADLLLVNKSNELSEHDQSKLSMELQGVNAIGKIILTNFSKVPMKMIQELSYEIKADKQRAHVDIDLHLRSYVYTFQNQVSQTRFEDFLRSIPETIYRIKGYIKFGHATTPYLFQYSYGMPMFLKEEMDMPLHMVFIGERVDWEELERKLIEIENEA